MRIGEALRSADRPSISFEFFPPQTDEGVEKLLAVVRSLRGFDPSFVSVTYGAGGSTRARTLEVVKRIDRELGIAAMAHVTCVDHTRDELRELFDDLASAGVENVMALRGDPPRGSGAFEATPGGFRYASELIAMLASEYDFSIGAGAYPERHPEAPSDESDIAVAAEKVARGASFLVTQFGFDNDAYFRYVDRARAAGIAVPIVPGIMPIGNVESVARMLTMNGGTMPARLHDELEARRGEPEAVVELGVAFCALQCRELLGRGAPGLHFYTLNKSTATRAVVSALHAGGVLALEPATTQS